MYILADREVITFIDTFNAKDYDRHQVSHVSVLADATRGSNHIVW